MNFKLQMWCNKLGDESQGPITAANGVIFQGADQDLAVGPPALFAVNASNGVLLNHVSLGAKRLLQGGCSIANDIVYIGSGMLQGCSKTWYGAHDAAC